MATATENLEAIADRVVAVLKDRNAIGREHAIPQADVAHAAATNTRTLQQATLVLNRRNIPVVSSCTSPMGIYLAANVDEVTAYGDQLESRLKGNAQRLSAIRQIVHAMKAEMSVEPNGQRRMCFVAG